MKILGISAYFHDSAAAIVADGKIIAAVQEERLTRIKHDSSFPLNAIKECLSISQLSPAEIDSIVFFEKPFLKFERILETFLAFAPKGFRAFLKSIPVWLNEKLFQKKLIQNSLLEIGFTHEQIKNIFFSDHHLSHAASAFYPSPFQKAIILTMDGVGEWATTSVSIGDNNIIRPLKAINFPHSLGLIYSAFTYYCGFKVNSGEYKLMGLAPYGVPRFSTIIKDNLIQINNDGSFSLNLDFFDYCTGLRMTNTKFDHLFGNVQRSPESELKQVHMDIAASIQEVTEEIILKICINLKNEFQLENLCMAGGVALNCVANGKIYRDKIFKNIFVQPASGDAGGALGAALALYHMHFQQKRHINEEDSMHGSYLGNEFSDKEIEETLKQLNATYTKINSEDLLLSEVSKLLTKAKTIGWFQGKMEFGPRALGNRSIIADPRNPEMQKILNLKIKFRESFRPFAPAILEEKVNDYFEFSDKSPYMLMVAKVQKRHHTVNSRNSDLFGIDLLNCARSNIPAVTHVDHSARIQTVSAKTNPKFYNLLKKFYDDTGCPILINTSFNIRGEPIVCSPQDAYRCFMGTGLDVLVLNNYILLKEEQPKGNFLNYSEEFKLD